MPIVLLLYLMGTAATFAWASLLACGVMVVGGVAMLADVFGRPSGQRLVVPRRSILWIGVTFVLLGQTWASAGAHYADPSRLGWGWLLTGAGASEMVWLWRVLPVLSSAREAVQRATREGLPGLPP